MFATQDTKIHQNIKKICYILYMTTSRKSTAEVTELLEEVHMVLRAHLQEKNMSQAELARRSSVPRSVISRALGKDSSVLSLWQFQLICEALGISPHHVLRDAEKIIELRRENQAAQAHLDKQEAERVARARVRHNEMMHLHTQKNYDLAAKRWEDV